MYSLQYFLLYLDLLILLYCCCFSSVYSVFFAFLETLTCLLFKIHKKNSFYFPTCIFGLSFLSYKSNPIRHRKITVSFLIALSLDVSPNPISLFRVTRFLELQCHITSIMLVLVYSNYSLPKATKFLNITLAFLVMVFTCSTLLSFLKYISRRFHSLTVFNVSYPHFLSYFLSFLSFPSTIKKHVLYWVILSSFYLIFFIVSKVSLKILIYSYQLYKQRFNL